MPVQDADLIRRREDVGQEQNLLVGELLGNPVDGVVRERNPRVRSEPQIVELSIRTTMSLGSMISGSSTMSQLRWLGPW
jgi:hypothetical protein